MSTAKVQYVNDATINESFDREIRDLLTTCFTKPQDIVFRERRYFATPYPNRWVIRDTAGTLVAHLGGHEKTATAGGEKFPVGGIGEVCVHPDCRGRGYAKRLLAAAHEWFKANGFLFVVLFGKPEVYGSSGYEQVHNIVCKPTDSEDTRPGNGLVCTLGNRPWPAANVVLPGPKF